MLAASADVAGVRRLIGRWGAAPGHALRAIGLLVASLANGCDDGCCWLVMRPGYVIDNPDSVVVRRPVVRFTDPADLAGLQIEVHGRTFGPEDFLVARDYEVRVKAGRTGLVTVFAKLVHDGSVVADGFASWTLRPETLWGLRFARGPDSGLCPEACSGHVLIPIEEAAARYPGEQLWLIWYSWPHNPDPDTVFR